MRLRNFAWVLVALFALPLAEGAIESTYQCSHPACLEGTGVNFTVTVENNLNENIVVGDTYIRDVESGRLLAYEARKETIIPTGNKESFVLPATVRAPARGYTIYYVPCFQAKSFNETGIITSGEVCGTTIKSLTVVPLDKVECRTDEECSLDQYCNTYSLYKCRPLDCLENQTVGSHRCLDLVCNLLQYPKDHRCIYNRATLGGLLMLGIVIVAFAFALVVFLKPRRRKRK
jgi:hypothetical protein